MPPSCSYFLAQKLVSKPGRDRRPNGTFGIAVPYSSSKSIRKTSAKSSGRAGRVAQALRTLVRASAEGKVGVEIIEVEDVDEDGIRAAKATAAAADRHRRLRQRREIPLGRIVGIFGVRGEYEIATSSLGESTLQPGLATTLRFEDGRAQRAAIIERARPHKKLVVAKIEGMDTANHAEALVGASSVDAPRACPARRRRIFR